MNTHFFRFRAKRIQTQGDFSSNLSSFDIHTMTTTLPAPDQASTDKKEYRSLQLPNGLRVLLISDTTYDLEKLEQEENQQNEEENSDEESNSESGSEDEEMEEDQNGQEEEEDR